MTTRELLRIRSDFFQAMGGLNSVYIGKSVDVLASDVVKVLKGLRRRVVVGSSSRPGHFLYDCGIAGPESNYKGCWFCSMPKTPGHETTTTGALKALASVIDAASSYEFELWPSRNGKAAVLKAIDAAIELARGPR